MAGIRIAAFIVAAVAALALVVYRFETDWTVTFTVAGGWAGEIDSVSLTNYGLEYRSGDRGRSLALASPAALLAVRTALDSAHPGAWIAQKSNPQISDGTYTSVEIRRAFGYFASGWGSGETPQPDAEALAQAIRAL